MILVFPRRAALLPGRRVVATISHLLYHYWLYWAWTSTWWLGGKASCDVALSFSARQIFTVWAWKPFCAGSFQNLSYFSATRSSSLNLLGHRTWFKPHEAFRPRRSSQFGKARHLPLYYVRRCWWQGCLRRMIGMYQLCLLPTEYCRWCFNLFEESP